MGRSGNGRAGVIPALAISGRDETPVRGSAPARAAIPGRMRAAAAIALLAVSVSPASGADSAPRPLPRVAEGEISAIVDAALFLNEAGRPETYFCIAVPQDEVACVEAEDEPGTRMELDLRLTDFDSGGHRLLERSQRLDVACVEEEEEDEAGERPSLDRLIYLRAPWQAGAQRFELRIADLNSVRAGLVYQIRGENKRGLVIARAPSADLRDTLGVSGCLLLWSFRSQGYSGQGNYWTARAEGRLAQLTPHPAHSYGLRNGVLPFYLEAYTLDREPLLVVTRVTRRGVQEPLFADTSRVTLPAPRSALARELDVRRLPAGSYLLEVVCAPVSGGEDAAAYHAEAEFQMLWRPESWVLSEQALLEEAALFFDEEEYARFRDLGAGEREVMAERFWREIDGPSGSLDGPTRALFHERIALADSRFGALVRGSQTDRGRVLVRFGEPDEIHKELMPLERDRIAYYLQREIDAAQRSDTGDPMRRSTEDTSSYEVWTYTSWGRPLFSREGSVPTHGRPLQFIFVDELGTGQYKLIYSNLKDGL